MIRLAPAKTRTAYLIVVLFLTSCRGAPEVLPTEVINVAPSLAAWPWLEGVYGCAEAVPAIIRISTVGEADLTLRLGEPAVLVGNAYQVGVEDLLIVVHRESSVQNLTLADARAVFSGTSSEAAEPWVYPRDSDVQQIFRSEVMAGRNVAGSARIAASPQEMSDLLNSSRDAVGILPRRWKVGSTREVLAFATVPVLAITSGEPVGALRILLACLQ